MDGRTRGYYVRRNFSRGPGLTPIQRTASLKTKSKAEALRRFPVESSRLQREIEGARRTEDGLLPGRRVTVEDRGRYWRQALATGGDDAEASYDVEIERSLGQPIGQEEAPDGTLQPAYDPRREAETLELTGIVTGERLTVGFNLDTFIGLESRSTRYVSRIRLAERRLVDWLRTRPEGNVVRAVTRRTAQDFVTHLGSLSISAKTLQSMHSALSSYWGWMEVRGDVEANVWTNLRKPKAPPKASMRPFTSDEIVALLTGTPSPWLHDFIRVKALTGMRLNEVGNLMARDVNRGWLAVTDGKTDAAIRRVPVHPDIADIITKRASGKPADAYLFHDLPSSSGPGRGRADKAGEHFTKYRRSVGVDDRRGDSKRSLVDFHSIRRWFITEAVRGCNAPHMVSELVGHEEGLKGMTLGPYYSGATDEQLKAVVAAVQLPQPSRQPEPA